MANWAGHPTGTDWPRFEDPKASRQGIDRFPAEERRALLVTLLGGVAPISDMATVLRLTEVMASDPSERVRAAALETLGLLRRRVRQ